MIRPNVGLYAIYLHGAVDAGLGVGAVEGGAPYAGSALIYDLVLGFCLPSIHRGFQTELARLEPPTRSRPFGTKPANALIQRAEK